MRVGFFPATIMLGLMPPLISLVCSGSGSALPTVTLSGVEQNGSLAKVIRVVQPGVFDVQASDYVVRMRAWGVAFPRRDQPGYGEALSFTERKLVLKTPKFKIKREFDDKNLKVADVLLMDGAMSFAREAIAAGIGWHLEEESGRYGPFVIAQLKAKRSNLGVWGNNFNYQQVAQPFARPNPQLPNALNGGSGFVPSISFWVTSLGKIHRPGCSFYQRGKGILTRNPSGRDCRICGGRKAK
jgi:hypothetical protein